MGPGTREGNVKQALFPARRGVAAMGFVRLVDGDAHDPCISYPDEVAGIEFDVNANISAADKHRTMREKAFIHDQRHYHHCDNLSHRHNDTIHRPRITSSHHFRTSAL